VENPLTKKTIRIGEVLIQQGVLSEQQVFEIIQAQKQKPTPFGVLAERMFDVTVDSIESAWIEQYHRATGTIDLSQQKFDEDALRLINRRQAWQFEMLPIAFEPTGELLIAASRRRLARAVTFVAKRVDRVAFFRIAESQQLRTFLQQHFPMPDVSEELLRQAQVLSRSA